MKGHHIKFRKNKIVLLTRIVNVIAFKQTILYLFGFNDYRINFSIQGNWCIADNLYIFWNEIANSKLKNRLLKNEM